MRILLLLLIFPSLISAQKRKSSFSDTVLNVIPYKEGIVTYERIYFLDTVENKEKVFNAIKSALLKNTNYKQSKIDEDRILGNITAYITFDFTAKPGISKLLFNAKTILSIDIKENRYRLRLYNNTYSTMVLGYLVNSTIEQQFENEREQLRKGKWKPEKSTILNWHEVLTKILTEFPRMVNEGFSDEF